MENLNTNVQAKEDGGSAQNQSSPPSNKKWIKIAIYVLIAIGVFFLLRKLLGGSFSHVEDAELTEFDQETIDSVLNSGNTLQYPFPADTSPTVIELPGGPLTDAQVLALTEQLFDRYSAIAARIADKLESDVQSVFDVTVIVAAQASGDMSTDGLDLYFRCLESWSTRWSMDLNSVAQGVAVIADSQFDAINSATRCSKFILVKEIVEHSEQSSTENYTVTIGNASKGGFLGMNKRKSSTETRETIKEYTRVDDRTIRYLPVCVDWQLEPTEYAAILSTGTLAIQMLYGLLNATLASAPSPAQFVRQ